MRFHNLLIRINSRQLCLIKSCFHVNNIFDIYADIFLLSREERIPNPYDFYAGSVLLRHHNLDTPYFVFYAVALENLYKPEYKRTAVDIIILSFRFLWSQIKIHTGIQRSEVCASDMHFLEIYGMCVKLFAVVCSLCILYIDRPQTLNK